jgi:hypothetical protein
MEVYERWGRENNNEENNEENHIKQNEEIDETPNDEFEKNQDDDIVQVIPTITRRVSDVQREIRNMTTFYNPNPGETTEIAMLARVFNSTELTYAIHDS